MQAFAVYVYAVPRSRKLAMLSPCACLMMVGWRRHGCVGWARTRTLAMPLNAGFADSHVPAKHCRVCSVGLARLFGCRARWVRRVMARLGLAQSHAPARCYRARSVGVTPLFGCSARW
eukprot:14615745-Alexandrium_andersonii.AAC.1